MKRRVLFGTVALVVVAAAAFAGGVAEGGGQVTAAGFNRTGLPIMKEPLSLTAVASRDARAKHWSEFGMFRELEKATNVKIDWELIANVAYQEKKNLMLASGDLPDLFFAAGLSDIDIMTNLKSFRPLKKLINDYAPTLVAFLNKEPELRKMIVAPDGEIYSIPKKIPHRPSSYGYMAINKKWLEKLGLKEPTTVDEFYQVLKAFKEKDPNGNRAQDEIPLSDSLWVQTEWWYGVFSMPRATEGVLQVNNGKVAYLAVGSQYKAMVTYLHKLYSEGLLDKEFFTQNERQLVGKATGQGTRIVGAAYCANVEHIFGLGAGAEYGALAPVSTPQFGKGLVNDNSLQPYARNVGSITSKNKYPEVTMRWLDQMYTDDMSVQLQYGSFGETLKKTADGRYEFLPLPDPTMNYDTAKWVYSPANGAPMGVYPELEARIVPYKIIEGVLATAKQMEKYIERGHVFPPVYFAKEDSEQIASLQTDINTLITQKRGQWIVKGGVEQEWDAYIDQLNKMGLLKLLEIYQKGYENYNKVK